MAVYAGFAVGVPLSALIAPERFAMASATAFLSSQLLDVWMFDKLRHKKPWWRAPLVSTTVSSGLDSGIFATLAWYGTDMPWITLGLGNVGVLMQSIAFGSLKLGWLLLLLTAFVSSQLFFLLGLWGTVQFRWVQLQYPAGMVICERVLLGATPVVAAMIIGWGVTEALGVRQAPFYLVAAQCVLHWFFGVKTNTAVA